MSRSCIMRVMVSVCLIFGLLWVFPGEVNAFEKNQKKKQFKKVVKEPMQMPKRIQGFKMLSKMELKQRAIVKDVKPVEVIKGDHVANGVALRNRGGGVINLRSVPAKVNIHKAYLYWCFLANDLPKCMRVSINGVEVKGKLVGKGNGPCWGVTYNFVYRAAVPLYLLYKGGNGDYKISGVPSSQGYGMGSWDDYTRPFLAEGATLVVFFTRNTTYKQLTYLYDSAVSGTMFTNNFSANLLGFTASKPTAKFTMIGADGQTGNGNRSYYNCTKEQSFFQGNQIAGIPAPSPVLNFYRDADSDWNGSDGEPLNQLWDTRTHIVPIKPGSTSAKVEYRSYGDCLVIGAFILTI